MQQIAAITQKSQQDMQQKLQDARQNNDFSAIREIFQQSRKDTHEKEMAVLNDRQKAMLEEQLASLTSSKREMVEKCLQEHPQPGPGGFGPPPGGPGTT